jgi:hypothetical protein
MPDLPPGLSEIFEPAAAAALGDEPSGGGGGGSGGGGGMGGNGGGMDAADRGAPGARPRLDDERRCYAADISVPIDHHQKKR